MQKCNSTHSAEQQHEGKDLRIEDIRRFLKLQPTSSGRSAGELEVHVGATETRHQPNLKRSRDTRDPGL